MLLSSWKQDKRIYIYTVSFFPWHVNNDWKDSKKISAQRTNTFSLAWKRRTLKTKFTNCLFFSVIKSIKSYNLHINPFMNKMQHEICRKFNMKQCNYAVMMYHWSLNLVSAKSDKKFQFLFTIINLQEYSTWQCLWIAKILSGHAYHLSIDTPSG